MQIGRANRIGELYHVNHQTYPQRRGRTILLNESRSLDASNLDSLRANLFDSLPSEAQPSSSSTDGLRPTNSPLLRTRRQSPNNHP